ncbi:MAG: hypothetical protein AAB526_00425 [Patescibacteria group bacterium]
MQSIIIGLLIIIAGFFLVIKTEWFIRIVGINYWAERWFGTEGGTRMFYKLLGILFCFIGFLTMTGLIKPMVMSIITPLFGRLK